MKKRYSFCLAALLLGGTLVFSLRAAPPVPELPTPSADAPMHAVTRLSRATSEPGLFLYHLALQYLRQ